LDRYQHMENRHRAPLYERILEHRAKRPSSFHVPGHKQGTVIPDRWESLKGWMALDYTELTGLDDLHQPEGVIREAEQLAAECYGADRTYFLVQGSTLGNLACILGVCDPGDLILADRFVHKSVVNGLMLAEAQAVFLSPVWDPVTGYACGIDERSLEQALHTYPHAKAVFLTRPNYFGQASDLTALIRMAHRFGIPVIVDEAHGAHFGFHEEVPLSALRYGADAVVQSTHKMLAALTMGSMLHLQGERINRTRIERAIRMLQTSSPSYPIMASLDAARCLMHTEGHRWVANGLAAVRSFCRGMAEMPWFILPASVERPEAACGASPQARVMQDPFKQPVRDGTGLLSGYRLQTLLEEHGCMVEMADERHILLVFSPFSSGRDSERIVNIFRLISMQYGLDKKERTKTLANISVLPNIPVSTEPVKFSRHLPNQPEEIVEVPLSEAVGARSADMIIPYPPGIPFVYPGERFDRDVAEALRHMASLGARFQGSVDSSLSRVRVYRR